jgi:hypothetical protein
MANETKFLDGLRIYSPREGAPDFVKGAIVINVPDLIGALTAMGQDEVRLDIKESKAGNLYASINEYVKPQQTEQGFEPFGSSPVNTFEADEIVTIPNEEEMF